MAHGKHTQHPSVSQIPTHPQELQTSPLSQREIEVLQLLTKGLINKEIADRLCVSLPTVVTHRKNITDKLGIKSVSALTVYALTHGLIKVEDI
jgi:DNA-binding NarL/FixJ family response regulator